MKIIGVTGPIGAGKSYVMKLFEKYGLKTISTDEVYHSLINASSDLSNELIDIFGPNVAAKNGGIDRKKLADIVFSDKKSLERLNAVSHRYVEKETLKILDAYRTKSEKAVAVEVPLMFESGFDKHCDVVVCVVAGESTRIERIRHRNGLTEEEAQKRLKNQKDINFYIENSQIIVYNENDSKTEESVKKILARILNKKTEENNMNQICKEIGSYGLIPVIKIDDPEKAVPLAKALCDGGLPVAEITFRTKCAGEAIAKISKEYPDMLVGAGTVLTTQQADEAVAAGAKFIVTPGFNPKIVKYCVDKNIPIVPGTSRPSDVEAAIELGLDTVKFFPAEAAGGIPMLKSLGGPYADLMFMPTGGIDEKNLLDYLKLKNVLACGGSFMVKTQYIQENRFDLITADVKLAMTTMLGFKLAHLGINCENAEEAKKSAFLIEKMFGMSVKEGNSSVFADTAFEFMKSPYLGKNGHIAISTNFIDRAVAYFERNGFKFSKDSAKYNEKGKLSAIYFEDDFFGFAIHLVQSK